MVLAEENFVGHLLKPVCFDLRFLDFFQPASGLLKVFGIYSIY